MAAVLTSLAEYLATTYQPDCDFVDGEIEERNVGRKEHSAVQAFFAWFVRQNQEWRFSAYPELRIQVNSDRVRVADVAILPCVLSCRSETKSLTASFSHLAGSPKSSPIRPASSRMIFAG